MSLAKEHRLIAVLDGECVVCSNFARFITHFNPVARIMWAQHTITKSFLAEFNISFDDVMRSVVVVKDGKVYRGSDAFIQILSTMVWYLRVVGIIISLFPHVIREWVYQRVANNRYTLFGKKDACTLPTPSMRAKFLHPI